MEAIASYNNICNYIHLPVQSGNSRVLEMMRRGYTREWYKDKVTRIREIIPDCAISTDIITGFCSETEEEHQDTLSLIEWSRFSQAFMFFYSERPGTLAQRQYPDDIPLEVKKRRLNEVIELQNGIQADILSQMVGKELEVLIEGDSKRSEKDFCGRNDYNIMTIFPKNEKYNPGDYAKVRVAESSAITLKGGIV